MFLISINVLRKAEYVIYDRFVSAFSEPLSELQFGTHKSTAPPTAVFLCLLFYVPVTRHVGRGSPMLVTLDLTPFELQTLADFRRYHAQYQRTTSSMPELELGKLYSALSTSAQILAESMDKAAQKKGATPWLGVPPFLT